MPFDKDMTPEEKAERERKRAETAALIERAQARCLIQDFRTIFDEIKSGRKQQSEGE